MEQSHLSVHQSKLNQTVVPLLIGRVFHVTKLSSLPAILEKGILHNQGGDLHSPFGYANGYFKCRGCVSFFDFRGNDAEEKAMKCHPLKIGSETNFALLYLSTESYGLLRDWSEWKRDEAYRDQIVPYVEVGYPGNVPISAIDEVLTVDVHGREESLAHMIRHAWFGKS